MNNEKILRKIGVFLTESSKSVGRYILGKLLTSLIIGFIAYVVFKILDINLPWLLAIILGVTNIIPILGPWIGLIVCAAIIVFFEPIFVVYTTLVALVLQIIEQFLLLPVIIGKAVDLKPILIMCVIVIASILFGFWGMIFAVPVAAVLKIGYEVFVKGKNNLKLT